jgi:hypothetical protein
VLLTTTLELSRRTTTPYLPTYEIHWCSSTDQWIDLPPRIHRRRSRFTSYLPTTTTTFSVWITPAHAFAYAVRHRRRVCYYETPFSRSAFLPESTLLRISSVLLGSSAGSPMPGLLRRVIYCPHADLPSSSLQPSSLNQRLYTVCYSIGAGPPSPGRPINNMLRIRLLPFLDTAFTPGSTLE